MRSLRPVASLLVALVLTACAARPGDAQAGGTLVVLAASSLTEAFTDLEQEFESQHAGVDVALSFGPSDGLAQQIAQGSPADVFASASGTWMDYVESDGPGTSGRTDLARNRMVIIVPSENPATIDSIDDLASEGVRLVVAAEGVPVGDYAREVMANAGIAEAASANIVSNEEDAKAVLQRVLLGEADAGIVYVTDVTPEVAGDIASVQIPDDVNVVATYPIAVVADSTNASLAQEWVTLVTGPEGQAVLGSYGFMPAGAA